MPNKIIHFERFGGGRASLRALAFEIISDQDIKNTVRICNQLKVKKYVTSRFLTTEHYTAADFSIWIQTAKEGWEKCSYTYLIRDENVDIVGSINLRKELIHGRRRWLIGYWADQEPKGRGYMTNAVRCLLDQAATLKIKQIFAYAEPDNHRSQSVLKRVGMQRKEEIEYMGSRKILYEKNL